MANDMTTQKDTGNEKIPLVLGHDKNKKMKTSF